MNYIDIPVPGGQGWRVKLYSYDDKFYTTLLYYNIVAGGSPTVVQVDPGIGPINEINLGDIYQLVISRIPQF